MNKKGQSTVEYILLVTAVTAAIIFATSGSNSLFQKRLYNTMDITSNGMQSMAARLANIIP